MKEDRTAYLVVEANWNEGTLAPRAFADDNELDEWRERKREDGVEIFVLKATRL